METVSYKYPRTIRLLTAQDFKRLFDEPQKVIKREVTAFVSSNSLDHPRLGVVISKKREKRAVRRNRFKRLIREEFRLNQQHLIGLDIVIVANHRTAALNNEQLRACLHTLWQELIKLRAQLSAV